MGFLKDLISNYVLDASLLSWFLAQLIKTVLTLIFTKKLQLERMFGAGGMPSAHSATVCAMTVAMSKTTGVASPEFAIAVLFAIVVMYDAMGVRRAAGEQARVINAMLDEWDVGLKKFFHNERISVKNSPLFSKLIKDSGDSQKANAENENVNVNEQKESSQDNEETGYEPIKHTDARGREFDLDSVELKEFLGHTPLEVLAGALLGIVVALLLPKI